MAAYRRYGKEERGEAPGSKYPPAKPGALRWRAPQRGLIAIVRKDPSPPRPAERGAPSAFGPPLPSEREKPFRSAPPRAITISLSRGRGWPAPRVLTSGRGSGEGLRPQRTSSCSRKCQTPAASPAEPGDAVRPHKAQDRITKADNSRRAAPAPREGQTIR